MRTISVKQAYLKKFKTFEFDSIWKEVFYQNPETTGAWLLYGTEKQGKSTFAIMLADYLTKFGKVLYISAEEGVSLHFVNLMAKRGIDGNTPKIKLAEYAPFEDVEERLAKRQCPKIVVIDNITVYKDEINKKRVLDFYRKNEDKLIIFISHAERGQPDTAEGRLWKKLSKTIIQIVGQKAIFKGRGVSGELMIDEEKAMLYHGTKIKNQ